MIHVLYPDEFEQSHVKWVIFSGKVPGLSTTVAGRPAPAASTFSRMIDISTKYRRLIISILHKDPTDYVN